MASAPFDKKRGQCYGTYCQLGFLLSNLRQTCGYRQIDVSELAGLDLRHLQEIEAGKARMRIDTLYRLLEFYQMPVAVFFSLSESSFYKSFTCCRCFQPLNRSTVLYLIQLMLEHGVECLPAQPCLCPLLLTASERADKSLHAKDLSSSGLCRVHLKKSSTSHQKYDWHCEEHKHHDQIKSRIGPRDYQRLNHSMQRLFTGEISTLFLRCKDRSKPHGSLKFWGRRQHEYLLLAVCCCSEE